MPSRLHHVTAAALVAALVFHFSATCLYLTPPNAIALRWRPTVDRYMTPYFAQAWTLFAPDPIVDTRELLVSCRIARADGSFEDSPWLDITTPLRDQRARYRIGPASALERAQTGGLHIVLAPPDPLIERLGADAENDPAFAAYKAQRAAVVEQGQRLLRRVASAACDRAYGRGVTTEVAVRMLRTPSPPFSHRRAPLSESETTYVDFPRGPYEPVAAF
jgi:hypothetical protein